MNHATICVIKNQLRHPFSQYDKIMQHMSTHISSSSFSYKNDSVVVSQKKKIKAKTNKKTLQVYAIWINAKMSEYLHQNVFR